MRGSREYCTVGWLVRLHFFPTALLEQKSENQSADRASLFILTCMYTLESCEKWAKMEKAKNCKHENWPIPISYDNLTSPKLVKIAKMPKTQKLQPNRCGQWTSNWLPTIKWKSIILVGLISCEKYQNAAKNWQSNSIWSIAKLLLKQAPYD